MTGVQTLTVGADEGDQRLDRWFRGAFPHVTQGRIEKMCRKGEIRRRRRPGEGRDPDRGGAGDPRAAAARAGGARAERAAPAPADADAEMIQRAVLWKDDHIIALNKPAGPAEPGRQRAGRPPRRRAGRGAEVRPLGKAVAGPPARQGHLRRPAPRPDRRASRGSCPRRSARARRRKIYWAAVAGVPHPRMGTIRYGLVKAPGRGRGGEGEKMLCVHPGEVDKTPDAKRATTDYAVLGLARHARRPGWRWCR